MSLRIIRCGRIASTQDRARELLRAGDAGPLAVVAVAQSAARGRRGRTWVSPEGGLYASLLVPYEPLLPQRIGVALVRALRRFGVRAVLKWPNDVLVEGGKLAGILIEREGDRAIAGIGVNLEPVAVDGAASVRQAGGRMASPEALLAALFAEFEGMEPDVLPAYRAALSTLGRPVRIERDDGVVLGEAVDVDHHGRLLVRGEAGLEAIASGECVHLRPARIDPGDGLDYSSSEGA